MTKEMRDVPAIYNLSLCNTDDFNFQYFLLDLLNRVETLEQLHVGELVDTVE